MIEIRIHGRGGQGVKKSAMLIARAAFLKGYVTQDFALYGAERRGAPVTSFVRLDKKKIGTRGYIFEPDFIISLDESIDHDVVLQGAKKSTKVIINTQESTRGEYSIDATNITLKETGVNIPNIAMLGAFAKVSKIFGMNELKKAVDIEFGHKNKQILNKNINAAKKCHEKVKCY